MLFHTNDLQCSHRGYRPWVYWRAVHKNAVVLFPIWSQFFINFMWKLTFVAAPVQQWKPISYEDHSQVCHVSGKTRSGNCQGISENVGKFWKVDLCQGILNLVKCGSPALYTNNFHLLGVSISWSNFDFTYVNMINDFYFLQVDMWRKSDCKIFAAVGKCRWDQNVVHFRWFSCGNFRI